MHSACLIAGKNRKNSLKMEKKILFAIITVIVLLMPVSSCGPSPKPSIGTEQTAENSQPKDSAPPSCSTWVEQYSPVREDNTAVDFADDNTGWVVGDIAELD